MPSALARSISGGPVCPKAPAVIAPQVQPDDLRCHGFGLPHQALEPSSPGWGVRYAFRLSFRAHDRCNSQMMTLIRCGFCGERRDLVLLLRVQAAGTVPASRTGTHLSLACPAAPFLPRRS